MATGAGLLRRRTAIPLETTHGARRLADVAALAPEAIARLCDASVARPGPIVFFDTETTSLASGAGVYVFLVGFAAIEGDRLVIDQLWLADPGAERALLHAAAERISGAALLCSFAGRGFDESRLSDRFRLARLPPPFVRTHHADLCPLARALWRSRLPSCSLGTIERERLRFGRADDLPGEACPEAYFRSLRGDPAAREAVLRHNLLDLLSTAVLAADLADRAAVTRDPPELLGLARYRRRRDGASGLLAALELALRAEAEDARSGSLRVDERAILALETAALLKRLGRPVEAADRWRALAARPNPPIDALVELAKHAEHRERDLDLAAEAATAALSLLRCHRGDLTPARRDALAADLGRRLARLQGKAAAGAGQGRIEVPRVTPVAGPPGTAATDRRPPLAARQPGFFH